MTDHRIHRGIDGTLFMTRAAMPLESIQVTDVDVLLSHGQRMALADCIQNDPVEWCRLLGLRGKHEEGELADVAWGSPTPGWFLGKDLEPFFSEPLLSGNVRGWTVRDLMAEAFRWRKAE